METLLERDATEAIRKNLSVCVLDDDADYVELTTTRLTKLGFQATGMTDPEDALVKVRLGECNTVLVDLKMPSMDGMTFLEKALRHDPALHVVLVSGIYSVDAAIEAVKKGAHDYLGKPIDFGRLENVLDELATLHSQRSEVGDLESRLSNTSQFQGIVNKIARHYTNVLVTGPTGAGKELVARAIHQLSPVAKERFAVCNCSALVDTLLESQLFGHVRGAFTGATDTRPGLFEYANGGTVFLDEVGETSLAMQAKLLRVIQNREIQRVGSPEVRHVDIRLIAATNRELRSEVAAGRFREDLFYRLSGVEIRVPGLAERQEDLPVLIRHFLKKYDQAYGKSLRGLSRRAQIVLLQHNWPGNVRELENVISSAAITATAEFIDIGDLPDHLRKPRRQPGTVEGNWRPVPLEEVRRAHIERVLQSCKGNRVRAAQTLGIGRTSLYRFLKRTTKRASAAAGAA